MKSCVTYSKQNFPNLSFNLALEGQIIHLLSSQNEDYYDTMRI